MGAWTHTVAKYFLYGFCCISATKEPVQPYNFISGLYLPFCSVTSCPPSVSTSCVPYCRQTNSKNSFHNWKLSSIWTDSLITSGLVTQENHFMKDDQEVQYISLKAPPLLVCTKNTALGWVSQGKYSTWFHLVLHWSLDTSPLCCLQTHSSALTIYT